LVTLGSLIVISLVPAGITADPTVVLVVIAPLIIEETVATLDPAMVRP
jgi:hypothetical protein